jgi:ribokinase
MYDIITFGSATRDVFLTSSEFQVLKSEKFRTGKAECVSLGSKVNVEDMVFTTGGGGTNNAVGFARQGLKTVCIVRVGDDIGGWAVIEGLKKEGVDTGFIQLDKKNRTSYSLALISSSGERTILVYRGAAKFLDSKSIKWSRVKAKWFYVGGSLSVDFSVLKKIFDFAAKSKIKIAWNPGSLELKQGLKKLKPLLRKVDIFIVNNEEASFLAGLPYRQERKIFKKLDDIVDGVIVITKGPKGVSVSDGRHIYSAGIPKSKVVERTGAGDAFGAGFVPGYIRKKGDISYAIQLGTANSTSVVQFIGAKTGLLKKGKWGPWPRVKVAISSV